MYESFWDSFENKFIFTNNKYNNLEKLLLQKKKN